LRLVEALQNNYFALHKSLKIILRYKKMDELENLLDDEIDIQIQS